jgi:hypothetical protein
MPTLAMVRRLIADESTLQLDLFAMLEGDAAPAKAAASLRQHVRHLRALLALLDRHGRDAARIALLSEMLSRHRARRAILFTHSIPTAQATFTALAPRHRLACLTSRGARLASGTLPRSVVLDAFRPRSAAEPIAVPAPNAVGLRTPAARIDALVATDVLSEGVDLHDASLLVHLDLPWTESRLQQRVGRLRRLGSPHADVVVEALAPPSASDALYGIVRRLAEKAGLAEYYVGRATNDKPRALSEAPGVPGSNAGHQRDAGTTGNPSAFDQHIAPGTCAPSPADRAEQVRTVISPWRQALRGVTLTDSNQPLVACCAGSVAGFVAVIEDELGPLVVARADGAGRDDVRADPTPVGRLLEGLSPIELDVDAPAADRARAHVARLIDGLDIIDDESRVMSGAQLRALRALRHTLGVRSRESRPALLTRLAHASERVRRARGAGASFAIADWLSALGGARPTLEKVAELDGALLARERSRAPRGAARLTALLLVLAMPAGFD